MSRIKDFANWCVRDKDGRVVIGQPANLPIIVAFAAIILTAVTRGPFRVFFGLVAFGALFTWSWLEIFDGTTPLRRVGGALMMVTILAAGLYVLRVATGL